MTNLRAEAIELINQMPEEELAELILKVKEMQTAREAEELRQSQEAFKELEKYFGRLPADFNYKKELEEYFDERYGNENLG